MLKRAYPSASWPPPLGFYQSACLFFFLSSFLFLVPFPLSRLFLDWYFIPFFSLLLPPLFPSRNLSFCFPIFLFVEDICNVAWSGSGLYSAEFRAQLHSTHALSFLLFPPWFSSPLLFLFSSFCRLGRAQSGQKNNKMGNWDACRHFSLWFVLFLPRDWQLSVFFPPGSLFISFSCLCIMRTRSYDRFWFSLSALVMITIQTLADRLRFRSVQR